MADNVEFQSGDPATPPAGFTPATDEIGGVHYQRVKPTFGVDGVATDVSASDPLPVTATISGTVSLPTGASTAAHQVTQNTALSAIQTAVELIDNTVSGSELQVDVVGALPAGNNNIGDVDVASVPAPLSTTGGGTEAAALRVTVATDSTGVLSVDDNGGALTVDNAGTFAVQAAQSGTWNVTNISGTVSLPTGASTLSEQQSQTTHLATIAGDTTDIEAAVEIMDDWDESDRAKVNVIVGQAGITAGAGSVAANTPRVTHASDDPVTTSVQLIDDTVVVLGTDTYTETTSKGLLMGAVRRDADTTLANTTNEFTPLQVDAAGKLKVEVFDGGDSHTVDNAGTFAVQVDGAALTALQLIDDPVATLGTTTYSEATTKGTIAGALRRDADTSAVNTDNEIAPLIVDANGYLKVEIFDGGGSHTVDNAGTFAVQVDGNALTSLQLIDDAIFVDDTATHATGSTKIMGIGGVAVPTDTAISANDIGMVAMSLNRGLHVEAQAGENHVGEVGGKSNVYEVTLTTDTAAYASGDLIADTQQLDAFFRKTDGTGVINSITIIDEEAQAVGFYLLFMKTSTSLGSENSAPNITDANLSAGLLGIVDISTTDWITISGTSSCCIQNIGLVVEAVSGTDDLYIAALNKTGTPDWDADSLKVKIGALLD